MSEPSKLKYLMYLLSQLNSPDTQIQLFCSLFTAPKMWGLTAHMGPRAQALPVLTVGTKVASKREKQFKMLSKAYTLKSVLGACH